ncbi:MAG TPA: anti-sigma factor antagonist [Phycisphaerales bacterium]|nr:anti-sigma factor antagonist [Phycisphaerales bacterium]
MRIETQNYNDITVIQLQGEFTAEAVKSFEDIVSGAFVSQISGIVLDMSKVVQLDSRALEQLVELNEQCRDRLRPLKLAGLDETCSKILEVTRLLPQFDTYSELTEAVKSFA